MIAPNLESSLDLNMSVLEPLLCVKIKIDRRMKFYGLYKCSLKTDLIILDKIESESVTCLKIESGH